MPRFETHAIVVRDHMKSSLNYHPFRLQRGASTWDEFSSTVLTANLLSVILLLLS